MLREGKRRGAMKAELAAKSAEKEEWKAELRFSMDCRKRDLAETQKLNEIVKQNAEQMNEKVKQNIDQVNQITEQMKLLKKISVNRGLTN
jgi:hypothetical protein